MALRATSAAHPPSVRPSPPPPKAVAVPSEVQLSSSRSHQLAPPANSLSLSLTLPATLVALLAAPNESGAEILPKEQIFSSLTQVESAIVSPSRVISAASRRFGTASSTKLLPGGSD